MSGEEARHAEENVVAQGLAGELAVLPDAGFVDLEGVELRILPQQSVPEGPHGLRVMAMGEDVGDDLRGPIDVTLDVEGREEVRPRRRGAGWGGDRLLRHVEVA